ncbi:MAG TPA: hypothetical protein VKR42_12605 [Ktedonobacteraceae bacterium]|nr:hypothetical protein [Ktedonobacteraceae bacterium]
MLKQAPTRLRAQIQPTRLRRGSGPCAAARLWAMRPQARRGPLQRTQRDERSNVESLFPISLFNVHYRTPVRAQQCAVTK